MIHDIGGTGPLSLGADWRSGISPNRSDQFRIAAHGSIAPAAWLTLLGLFVLMEMVVLCFV